MNIAELSEVIRNNPNQAETYYKRGIAYLELEDYRCAIEDFTQVVRLEPQNTEAYNQLRLARTKLAEEVGTTENETSVDSINAISWNGVGSVAIPDIEITPESLVFDEPPINLGEFFVEQALAVVAQRQDYCSAIDFLDQAASEFRRQGNQSRYGQIQAQIADFKPRCSRS